MESGGNDFPPKLLMQSRPAPDALCRCSARKDTLLLLCRQRLRGMSCRPACLFNIYLQSCCFEIADADALGETFERIGDKARGEFIL